ncbi:MAG TPA: MFS transporter [Terrimicrobiaceae bacterium]
MKTVYPRSSFNVHWFSLFNAVSFQVMMGAPIIVYAKSLGASSTVLGIIAAFTPLMTVFQLPAAQHLEHYGYRRFVLMGWGARTVLIFVVAAIPLADFLGDTAKLAALLVVLFFFNLLRGISSAALMPWITHLIPENVRGRFLSVDQFFMYGGCLVSLLVSALVMTGSVESWEYGLVFLLSAVAATVSLAFIKRIPEVPADEATRRRGSQNVPWREMLGYPPFRELLIFNLVYATVLGSLGVFTVEFLRDSSRFDVAGVLYLSAFSFVGALVALPFCGSVVDATGSKPLMRVATVMFAIVIAVWILLAASVVPSSLALVAALNFLTGAASANFNLANVRITMATMPEMGRIHFFALFTVITSLGLGGAPVAWGMILDAIGSYEAVTGAFHWKRHSIYFLALLALNAIAFAYIPRLHESAGARVGESSRIYARSKRSSEDSFS